jgi:glycosyltransferase involved in cell wall biosynthesis
MEIIAWAWDENVSSNVRAYQPLLELTHRGHMAAIHTKPEELTPSDDELDEIVETFDVAFLSRYHEPEAQELVRRLQEAGMPVVWDHDDDWFSSHRALTDPETQEKIAGIRAMLATADVVTTTSDRLADVYLEEGAECVITIPNYLPRAFAKMPPPPAHDGLVVGYAGWADHQRDWDHLGLKDVFCDLLDAHPQMRVESVGPIDLGLPAGRYRRIGTRIGDIVPYVELPRYVSSFDVGIAPLRDTDFNRGRSDIKLKEYGAAAVPWLASPVGPYEELGEDEGGRLVEDELWFEEVSALLDDKRARRKLAKRGLKWAHQHTLLRHANQWLDAFKEAVEIRDERRATV